MFMEAIMESLKDVEIRNPQAEQSTPSVSTVPTKASEENGIPASSQEPSGTVDTPSSLIKLKAGPVPIATGEACGSLKALSNSQKLAFEPSSSGGVPVDPSSAKESSVNTSVSSANSDSPASGPSSLDTNVSHNIKASLTVEKNNPAGHVTDSMTRRWDFNFFRNNNGRRTE